MRTVERDRFSCALLLLVGAAIGVAGHFAHANPVGPAVANGAATFTSRGDALSVVNTPGAIINWQQFSIGAGETTRFIQQSAASAVLNRVTGADPSRILGALQSNGRVFLINPSGIVFGPGSRIDVGGLVASTLRLSDADFLSGRLNFSGEAGKSAAVVNQGRIAASAGGRVYLVGSAVDNQGVITAPNGDIVLAAGQSVRVAASGTPGLQVEITAPADRAVNLSESTYGSRGIYGGLVRNNGTIDADSAVREADGRIVFKASAAVTLQADSRVSANGPRGGRIVIDGQQGTASVSGRVDAVGRTGSGGAIAIAGGEIGVLDGARLDASGMSGGGNILIGGDLHGAAIQDRGQALVNSRHTYVAPSAQIRADAIDTGDGGRVVVWADQATRFHGAISARGGAKGGDGGTVEVSGKDTLAFKGRVDTRAPRGRTGTLLLDPANIIIVDGVGDGDADSSNGSFSGTPSGVPGTVTAGDSAPTTIFRSELEGIAGTTNISLAATNSITINDLAGNNLNLAQGAGHAVTFQAGTFAMNPGDTITTAGGAINIITTVGGATIGSLAANGGAVGLNLAGGSTVAGGISGAGTTLTKSGAGTLTLNGISTYTGATTLSGGSLALGANGALPGATTVVVNGGTLDIGVFNQAVAGLQLISGSVAGSSGTLTSGSAYDLQSGTVSAILGGAVGLNKTTAGTVTLSGANSYTGATAVSAGVLNLSHSTAAGTPAGGVTVANGAALELQGGIVVGAEALSITGSGTGSGALRSVSGANSWGGTVTLAGGGATVQSDAGSLTLGAATAVAGAGQNLTVRGAGNTVVNGTIATTSGTLTKTGTGTLTLGAANLLSSTGALVVNGGTFDIGAFGQAPGGVQLQAGTILSTSGTLTSSSNYDLQSGTVSAILAGPMGVDKSTAGIVTLTRANTYTGATAVNAGTLAVTTNDALGTIAAGTTVASGATLDFQNVAYTTLEPVILNGGTIAASTGTSSFSNALPLMATSNVSAGAGAQLTLPGIISGAGLGITKTGTGTVVISGNNTYTGPTTVNAGTLALGASDRIADASSLIVNGGTFSIANFNETVAGVQLLAGTIAGTSGVLTSTSTYDLRAGTASAILAGDVGVNKTTTGTVVLSAANTYTGATAVDAGTLAVTVNGALGTIGAGTSVASGATLDFQNVAYTTLEPVTLNGGTIAASTGTSSFSNALPLGATSNVSAGAGAQLTLPGIISGAGLGITKTGTGTVVLSGNNTYTGPTTVNAGTLALGASDRIDDASSLVVNGGTFNIADFNETVAGVQLLAGTITGTSGILTSTSTYDLQAGTVSAIITGNVGVDKSGPGTVLFTRENTYTGATAVSAGTLAVSSNGALGTIGAGTTVEGGATLDFRNVAYASLEPLTLHGGTVATSTGTSSFDGPVSLTADSTGSVTGTQLTLAGVIGESGGAFGLTKAGAGTLVLTAANTYKGTTLVNAGTLALDGANDRLDDASRISVNGGTFDVRGVNDTVAGVQLLSGTITGTTGVLTSTSTFDLRSGTVSAIMDGTVGVDKTTGGTVLLTRVNTFTGDTAVIAGTLAVTSNGALGTTAAGTVVESGATLDFRNVAYTTPEQLTLHGGIVATTTGTSSFEGPVTLTADSTASVTGTRLTLVNPVGESGGSFGLTKIGTGTLVLSGINTYTGTTRINAGTVALGAGNDRLADASKIVVNGGTFDLASFSDTVAEVHLLAGTITGGAGVLTSTSNYDLQSGTVSAIIAGNVGADKSGPGTVTLTRDNTYTGATTVAAGTLVVTAADALGAAGAGTSVSSGATLSIVNAAVGAEPVALNGVGVGGLGALTGTGSASLAGDVTLASASTIGVTVLADSLELLGEVEGPGALTLAGAGTLTFGSSVGAATPLAALTQSAATRLNVNGGLIRTTGNQTYNGSVTTSGATTLRTTAGGNVSAPGAFRATAGTLTLDTGAGGASLTNALNDFSTVEVTSGGTVTLTDMNSIAIGNASLNTLSARALAGNVTLVGTVAAAGAGDSIVLVASGNFINNAGATALNSGPGRFLVYSTHPGLDTRGGIAHDFKQYNAVFGATVVLGSGDGFLYTVAPTVTPTLTGTVTKVYDATTAATLGTANYAYSGVLDGDTITLNNAASGTYDTPDVGTGKVVSVSGLSLPIASNGAAVASNGSAIVYGYQLGATSASAAVGIVTPAPLTITPDDQGKTYGQAVIFSGTEFASSGLQGGQTVGSVSLASAGAPATAHVAESPYAITASGASGGTFTPGNYTISYGTGALTINPAPLTVTADNQTKAYGGSAFVFNGTEFTASGLQNGDAIVGATIASAGAAPTAAVAGGPYPITISAATGPSFAPGDYAITYVPGTFTVNPAGVALTIMASNLTKTYGDTLNFAGTEFAASGLQNGETIGSVVLASPGAAAGAHVSASPYPITVNGARGGTFSPGNYTITYVNGRLTVVPAPLTIQADDASRATGAANPPFSATYAGFKLGETPAVLGGALRLDTAAVAGSPSGVYAIVPSGQTATDYAITFVNGALRVRQPAFFFGGQINEAIVGLGRIGPDDFNKEIVSCLSEDIASPPALAMKGLARSRPISCSPGAEPMWADRPEPGIAGSPADTR